jgi:Protein kinase domain
MTEVRNWAELREGDEFAGYRIERLLGRGGMGILFLAVEPGLDRQVALKLIAPEAVVDDVFAKRFAEESRIAASIEHPNVVPIYAAGEEEGIPFIAMRFVPGSDLGQRIAREGRLDPELAVALTVQVGNGLDAIHAAGLIHRDVKPANVLISGEEGEEHAYITDFGVARNVATRSGLTQTGRFVGTLDYVAPEQISGAPIDARADVYALGCLLHKLLTGEIPYPRDTEAARLFAHLNDPPPAPSEIAPDVSPVLDDIVARAMSKEPDDRYPSAGDLGRAAQAALSGMPVERPERMVATGPAATREAQTVPPTRQARSPTGSAGGPAAGSRTGPPQSGDGRRRRLGFIAGGLVAAVALVAAIVLVLDGGSGGSGNAQQAAAQEPDTLSEATLIEKADLICTEAQGKYEHRQRQFPKGEFNLNVRYSQFLVGISSTAVPELSQLRPPPSLESQFDAFLEVEKELAELDQDALVAAASRDVVGYLEAREKRNHLEGERRARAEAVGFEACAGSGI